jgi:uncharacterized protein YndB with AHSA1/START domain
MHLSPEKSMKPEPGTDGVFATSRLLPFPRMDVFAAFKEGTQLAKWWGPDGFRNTFEVFEFQAHGRWKFVMHGPDGKDYLNENTFLEATPSRIVIQHLSQPHFTLTISLTEQEDQTLLHWHQALEDSQFAANLRHIIEPANEQNLNRLHAVLAGQEP